LKKLIEHNLDLNATDLSDRNAIIWAASSGMTGLFHFYIHLLPINFFKGSADAIAELYEAGVDPDVVQNNGLSGALVFSTSKRLFPDE
jgi:hypothetical protein